MQALIDLIVSLWDSLLPWTIVDPWERGIRVRLGKWVKKVGPGPHFTLPFIDQVHTINVKRQVVDLPDQSVETSDRIPMLVSGSVTYSIRQAHRIFLDVQDHDDSLIAEVMIELSEWVNKHVYDEITIERMVEACFPAARQIGFRWGCEVERLGINSLSKHRVYRLLTQ
jgi:regulator of protease activity HflC (stomatin/prohibitin superfamily)